MWQTSELSREELICEYESLQCKIMEIEKFPGEESAVTEGMEQPLSRYLVKLAGNCRTFDRYGNYYPITLFYHFSQKFTELRSSSKQIRYF